MSDILVASPGGIDTSRNVVFAFPDWSDAATWVASLSAVAGAPTSNLITRQPVQVAGYDVSAADLVLLGTPTEIPFSRALRVVSIPYATATPAATWRVQIGDSQAEASGTTASDASGNEHHATIENGATFAAGKYEGGLDCDNPSDATTSQCLTTPTHAGLVSDDKTYMFWINPRRIGPSFQNLVFHPGGGTEGASIALTTGGAINAGNGSDPTEALSSVLVAGYFTHVAVTYASATATLAVYLDGVLAASVTLDDTPGFGDGDSAIDWGGIAASANGFDGILDDCRLYDAALTEAEIQAEMASKTPTITDSLILQYKLNGYDSGVQTFGAPPNLAAYARRASWLMLPYEMTNAVVRITISDPTNTAPLYIGRLVAGTAWQPSKNFDYGFRLGFVDETKKARTPTSQTTTTSRVPIPMVEFTVRHLSRMELLTHAYELQRLYGASRPFLVCCDPGDEDFLQLLTLYGLADDLSPFPWVYGDGWEMSWRMEAML